MKKILLSAIGVVLLGAAMSAFVSVKNESKGNILNENAEALAETEAEKEEEKSCETYESSHCYYHVSENGKGANYNVERHRNK